MSYKFKYRDRFGERSERMVDIRRVRPSTDGRFLYIEGHCHLRDEWRQFRSDRMLSDMVNTETGEVVQIASQYRGRHYQSLLTPVPAVENFTSTGPYKAGNRGGKRRAWPAVAFILTIFFGLMVAA